MRNLLRPLSGPLLALLLLLASGTLAAQDAPAAASSTPAPPSADQLTDQLSDIEQAIGGKSPPDDATLNDLRNKTMAIQKEADQLAGDLAPQSDSIKAKLDVLGAPPAKGAPPESPDITAQRKDLLKQQAALDSQIKQAKSLSVTSVQVANQIAGLQRDAFEAQISQRTASPLTVGFWRSLATDLSSDTQKIKGLVNDFANAVRTSWQPPNRLPFLACLIACLALLVGRNVIERFVLHLTAERLPAGHLRRSALATLITLITTFCIGFAAYLFLQALNWNGQLSDEEDNFTHSLVRLTCFAAYVAGIGRALLSVKRPSWRMPALSDDTAEHLRAFPWLLAIVGLIMGVVNRVNQDVGAGLGAVVITNGALSLVISGLIAGVLMRLGQARRAMLAAGDTPAKRPLWVGLLVGAAFAGVALCWLAVATGYFALAWTIARQMLWTGVVVISLYLFSHLVNDLFESLFSPSERTGKRMQEAFGVAPERLEQTAILLSGIARALLLLLAISLLFSRYGASPGELLGRASDFFSTASIGSLKLVPGDIINALLVVLFGSLAVRAIKQWLTGQLLPKTAMDAGLQSSLVTLLGYIGGIIVFVAALGALQVNLQSIAWVASALSVGIGFGLQAIVQNFISGLILLTERPVKVGDWVSLGGGVEGDIRRINVRATEIKMSDQSTMIVPNSQFISQNVRNVTLGYAQGVVKITLSLPLSTDAGKARKIILEVIRAHPATLETPSPGVTLDNLDGGTMTFVASGYVKSPRDVGSVKSDLLFALLEKLREAQMPLSLPQDMVIHTVHEQALQGPSPSVVPGPAPGGGGDTRPA